MRHRRVAGLTLLLLIGSIRAGALDVNETGGPDAFPLVARGRASIVLVDPDEAVVVSEVAAAAFAADVERVTGVTPEVMHVDRLETEQPTVVIGTIGQSDLIQQLIRSGRLDVTDLEGQWEAFKIVHLAGESMSSKDLLVIVGSDRRGTAYGVFEVSRAIGVSPWYWWADVPAEQRTSLHLWPDGKRCGPPSVKYRGVFINDEDWGLQPWAAKTFEPETNDIGPKTYAAIFELLLRLKANHIWPAMHPSTRAFNYYPENKLVADRYAIVMGSSHAEPMLRNNVDEWHRDGAGEWNFLTNSETVLRYWDARIAQNARFENVYTIGMRGVHDSAMVGSRSQDESVRMLERIFVEQRRMLHRHTGQPVEQVPQVFIPYKEVLALYRGGLAVPEDVTLIWVDDNFGYIRQLSSDQERRRSGGAGVYYHLSYWGKPHDFLWLCTTPPALVWEEMTKAYASGADRNWIVNVGDLKLSEIGMDWFLRLAWNIDDYSPQDAHRYLVEFCTENFGPSHAEAIADVMQEFYELTHVRKPEHMGWNRVHPNTPVQESEFSHWAHGDEAQRHLDAFERIQAAAEKISNSLPARYSDAFFELVLYPVRSAANMNRKVIYAEKSRYEALDELPVANTHAQQARDAYEQIQADTEAYNNSIKEGKWRHVIDSNPRSLPVFGPPSVAEVLVKENPTFAVRLEGTSRMAVPLSPKRIERLSRPTVIQMGIEAAEVFSPMKKSSTADVPYVSLPQGVNDIVQGPQGPARVVFAFEVERQATYAIEVEVNHPTDTADSWFVQIDSHDATLVNDHVTGGSFERIRVAEVPLAPGYHQLTVTAREDGAQLRSVRLVPASLPSAYVAAAWHGNPNRLPTLNPLTGHSAFIDLHNRGSGAVKWRAQTSGDWIKLSADEGSLQKHTRLLVEVDYERTPKEESFEGMITLTDERQTYVVTLPVYQPTASIPPGTYVQENGCIAIDAERFAVQTSVDDQSDSWQVIGGIGYSGAVVGLVPHLMDADLPLAPSNRSPSLEYSLYVSEGGDATITFEALPTHEINEQHALDVAFSIDGAEPQTVRFAQGNDENNRIWQRNVLRGSMTGSAKVDLAKGLHRLKVYGLDPSVVLDRILIDFGDTAPSYLGPRSTQVSEAPLDAE